MRAIRISLITTAITIALSGCTEEKRPTARPQPSPPTTSSTARPISAPMDLSGVDPCSVLTGQQAAKRGIEKVRPMFDEYRDEFCALRDTRDRLETSLSFYMNPRDRARRNTEIFEHTETTDYEGVRLTPTSIAGYPALQGSFGPAEDFEVCHIAIDVAETQGITLRQDGLRIKHRTCDDTLELAEIIIENLRGR